MGVPNIIVSHSWVAAVQGGPFGDPNQESENPCVALEVRRVAGRILAIVQLTETLSMAEVQQHFEWPIRADTPFQYSGAFAHCGAKWDVTVQNEVFEIIIDDVGQRWSLQINIDTTAHAPGAVVELTGHWGMYLDESSK